VCLDLWGSQQLSKGDHGWSVPSIPGDHKIVVFFFKGQKAQAVKPGHRLNGHPPIRPSLRHRRRYGIMAFGLEGVAGRLLARKQSIDQYPGPTASVSVDHSAVWVGQYLPESRSGIRLLSKSGIVPPKDQTLCPAIPRRQF